MPKRFSASSAAMLMSCSASANLELAIPNWVPPVVDPTKGAKGKGSALHALFEQAWDLGATDLKHFASAVTYVAELRQQRRFNVLIEQTVEATWLQTNPSTTADLVLYTQDELHVIDTKTGKIPVNAVENHQLLFYAASYAALAPKAKGVTVHIVQPWSKDGSSTWFITPNRLQQFIHDAQDAEQKIIDGDLTFGPSDHCTFCPANPHSRGDKGKPLCPAMMKLLYPPLINEDEILDL